MAEEAIHGVSLKYISLIVLCVQNSTLATLMHLASNGSSEKFNPATAVILGEALKVLASVLLVIGQLKKESIRTVLWNCFNNPKEMVKVSIPAVLYLIQNNLQYISIANLEPAVFQVLYQLKILTTAIFSVTLLRKKIILPQWGAIVLLMVGVACVQAKPKSSVHETHGNFMIGLLSVLMACTCSGFAGVYFEKILKSTASKASIWERNIQMGSISCVLGLLALVYNDFAFLNTKGFFHGYRPIVWSAVLVNALGGLLTAVVVKYADNILKAFATSIAIILSCIIAFFLFGKIPTLSFVFGAAFVNIAVYIYGVSPSWYTKPPTLPIVTDQLISKK